MVSFSGPVSPPFLKGTFDVCEVHTWIRPSYPLPLAFSLSLSLFLVCPSSSITDENRLWDYRAARSNVVPGNFHPDYCAFPRRGFSGSTCVCVCVRWQTRAGRRKSSRKPLALPLARDRRAHRPTNASSLKISESSGRRLSVLVLVRPRATPFHIGK